MFCEYVVAVSWNRLSRITPCDLNPMWDPRDDVCIVKMSRSLNGTGPALKIVSDGMYISSFLKKACWWEYLFVELLVQGISKRKLYTVIVVGHTQMDTHFDGFERMTISKIYLRVCGVACWGNFIRNLSQWEMHLFSVPVIETMTAKVVMMFID